METTESIVDNTGENNGSISINVTGGTAPYQFSWSNGATTQNISNLNGGDYTVTIIDANGCEQIFTYTVGGIVNNAKEPELSFDLKIYPNPVKRGAMTILEFNTETQEKVNVRLYDVYGKLIRTEIIEIGIGKTNEEILAPNVPGLYMIRIQAADGSAKTFELTVL